VSNATDRRYDAHVSDEDVILEGGDRDGQPVPFSAMTHDGAGTYVLHDNAGIYRHDEESLADFRNSQRIAIFEPSEPDPPPKLRLLEGGRS
jgi:hypothetical protein